MDLDLVLCDSEFGNEHEIKITGSKLDQPVSRPIYPSRAALAVYATSVRSGGGWRVDGGGWMVEG